ncbi:shikimate kinase [Candidatus Poribacteria bacterium]|nr:MAG: shikimate kinase [Candidatus Poribacteria bacterium]
MANIVLIGFMGTGKTSVGKKLSEILGYPMVDVDELIEQELRMSIPEIFKRFGERFFRDVEAEMIKKVSQLDRHIIATGGGSVLREENWANLRRNGVIFCLNATPEEIWRRVSGFSHRPLLNVPDPMGAIRELLRIRAPYYAKADHQIDTTGKSIDQVVEEILEILEALKGCAR